MIDDNLLRDNFKKILNIKYVFEEAKNDNGNTFLVEIKKLDKNILKEQLDKYVNNPEKVNKVRYDIIKAVIDGKKIELNDIEKFKDTEKEKFQGKDIFRSWRNFSILYSIYYYDKKDLVNKILTEINNSLVKDLGLESNTKTNIVDFHGAQNFGLENFWTAIYNKSHKSQRTALQLNITSFGNNDKSLGDNLISIGLGGGPDIKNHFKRNHKIININNLTYNEILEELKKFRDDIINDNYIKNNINLKNNNVKDNMIKETELLNSKKQIILYGPPGTGKTYNIKSIIENHSGEEYTNLENEGRVEFITFHQSFSYEEFIEGIKPNLDSDSEEISYKIEDGIFKRISEIAKINYINSLSNNDGKIDLDNIILNFNEYIKENFIDKGKDFPLLAKVSIKSINENKGSYLLGGSITSNQRLALNVVKRDLLDFIDGKIKKFEDIKPVFESERLFHGNARYYFMLYTKILEFIKNKNINLNKSLIKKEELKNYYLIIDEINRGNISKIFGELITLLECDKRIGEENEIITKLPYSKEDFGIPSNLFIVATMNTSDKSIVSLDTALRRRFGFVEMLPDYSLEELQKEIEGINLSKLLQKINNRIEYLLDKDHLIGHSYFIKINDLSDLKSVFYNEIIPLLEEYFYSEEEKIKLILGKDFFEKNGLFNESLFENKDDFEIDKNNEKLKDLNEDELKNVLEKIIN